MGEREAGVAARTARMKARYRGPVRIEHRPGSRIAERSIVVLAADAKKHNVLVWLRALPSVSAAPAGHLLDGMKVRSSLAGTTCCAGPQDGRRVVITRKEARRCGQKVAGGPVCAGVPPTLEALRLR